MHKRKAWGLTLGLFFSSCGVIQTTDVRTCSFGNQTSETGVGVKVNGAQFAGDEVAQGVRVTTGLSVSKLEVRLMRSGSPTHLLRASIQTDNSASPSGTDVGGFGTALVTNVDDTADGEWVEFTLSAAASLSANTQYWLVLRSLAAQDATNYVTWMGNSSNPLTTVFAMAETSTSAPATWVASGTGLTATTDLLVRFGCN